MSKSGSLSSVPTEVEQDPYPKDSPKARKAPRRSRGRKERRFEIGLFLRKTVNGWLEYYKLFPPRSRRTSKARSELPVVKDTSSFTASASMEGDTDGGVDDPIVRASTHPPMNDDPGPGTETTYEMGLVLRVVEESGDSEEDDAA